MSQRSTALFCLSVGLGLLLSLAPPVAHGQTITGQTVDANTDAPVKGAVVVLTTPDGKRVRTTQTDSLGQYTLVNLDSDQYVIKARRVGYQVSEGGPFTLSANDTLSVNLSLRPTPVAMQEVTVSAEVKEKLQDVGFYKRQTSSSGSFLDRSDIEDKHTSVPSELFRSIPGMRMAGQIGQAGGPKPFIQTSGRSTIKPGGSDSPCVPTIVIDGSVARKGGVINLSTTPRLNDLVSVSDIYAMEVYPRVASAPAQFSGTMSPCGLVLVWTGRGY